MNDALRSFGRICFAIGIAGFGVQYLIYRHYLGGLPPVPPWAPGGAVGAYFAGIFLILAAIAIAVGRKARLFTTLLASFFFLCVLFLHFPRLNDVLYNGNDRTRAMEPLAMAAGAFVLAGTLPLAAGRLSAWDAAMELPIKFGRFLYALTMVIFGMQHFEYAGFISTLIPAWIPGHLFWVYFTGLGFIAAAVAISLNILGRLAALSLGLMFLLWFIVLHAPRVFASIHNGDEWASAFVALALAGTSFVIASVLPNQPERAKV